MSNCYKTRSSSLPSRGGLICAFHSYFLKQNDNKSSLHRAPWLERPFLLWLPGIKVVSILDGDAVMSWLLERCSLSPECSLLQTAVVNAAVFNVLFNCIIFKHGSRLFLKFCAVYQHFPVPLSCSHLVTDYGKFFLAQKHPKRSWWWKVCHALQSYLNRQTLEHRPAPLTVTVDRRTTICQISLTIYQRDVTQCENSSRQVLYKLPGSADRSTYASQ